MAQPDQGCIDRFVPVSWQQNRLFVSTQVEGVELIQSRCGESQMRNRAVRSIFGSLRYSSTMTLAALGLLAGCVSSSGHPDWIRVDTTTKHDVIERYGPPDMVIASPGGDIAVYRPIVSAPRLEIPTAQIGPSGTAVTSMQRIDPGLGALDLNRERTELLRREIRIRYDSQGIVQELTSP